MKPVGYRSSLHVAAALLAYSAFSILLIFLNKTLLSKLRASRESVVIANSSVHLIADASASASVSAPGKGVSLVDIDILRLTFTQCAFTALAIRLVLRFTGADRNSVRVRFGVSEVVASTLFVAMLISSNLCLKLIPVSVLPVSRSLTFIFVLALDRVASRLQLFGGSSRPSQSLFTVRRCLVYALILFGYIGAIEVRGEPKANEASMLTGFLCGVFNSLVSALTSIAMKYTMHKRNEEAEQSDGKQPSSPRGILASVRLCYAMNLYAASLGAVLFVLYLAFQSVCAAPNHQVAVTSMSLSYWLSPVDSWSALVSFVYSLANANWPLLGLFAVASCTTVLVSALNLVQLELCTPLTVQISNATKSVALTLIAVMYYREHHELVWYAANLSMLAGTLLYATESRSKPDQTTVTNEASEEKAVEEEEYEEQVYEASEYQDIAEAEAEVEVGMGVAKQDPNEDYLRMLDNNGECVAVRRKSIREASFTYAAMLAANDPRNANKQILTYTKRGKQRSRSRIGSQYTQNGSLKNLHMIKKRP